ncbi:MAG: hypothetical protein AB7V27_02970 [Candidatus Binatia bacterium]
MRPRTRRAVSVALSIGLHALLLLQVWTWTVAPAESAIPELLPVRIMEPAAARQPAAPQSAPPQAAPPEVAKVEPPAVQPPPPEPPKPEPEPEPEKKIPLPEQIVSPPDAGENEVPPDTRFKSDQDVRVKEQQVKRGEPKPGESGLGEDAESDSAEKAPPPKPQPPKPQQRKPLPAKPAGPQPPSKASDNPRGREPQPRAPAVPDLDRLMPDALRLAQQGYGQPPVASEEQAEQAQRRLAGGGGGTYLPMGPIGTLDYLPDVREGDITLLNTKAEVFAPFVRRVAMRVFQNFWISLRRELSTNNLSAEETVQAEAVMSPSGEMLRFTILERSSRVTLSTDRRLQQACNVAFFDRNPPPGARWQDGNIHFVFATTLQTSATPRGPTYWVHLAAGLK